MTPEQANDIIIEWRGECRHDLFVLDKDSWTGVGYVYCKKCSYKVMLPSVHVCGQDRNHNTNYSDLSAWNAGMYDKIEEKGLWEKFKLHTCANVNGCLDCDSLLSCRSDSVADVIKTSPEQKAIALATTIKESE